jgi:hypothetical protein
VLLLLNLTTTQRLPQFERSAVPAATSPDLCVMLQVVVGRLWRWLSNKLHDSVVSGLAWGMSERQQRDQ